MTLIDPKPAAHIVLLTVLHMARNPLIHSDIDNDHAGAKTLKCRRHTRISVTLVVFIIISFCTFSDH